MTKDQRHAIIDYLILLNWTPTKLMGNGPFGWDAALHCAELSRILYIDKKEVRTLGRVTGFNRTATWDSISDHELALFENYIRNMP